MLAAETGTPVAYDYPGEAAMMDLADPQLSKREGLHMAALAGSWTAVVLGLDGMRWCHGVLEFAPPQPRR